MPSSNEFKPSRNNKARTALKRTELRKLIVESLEDRRLLTSYFDYSNLNAVELPNIQFQNVEPGVLDSAFRVVAESDQKMLSAGERQNASFENQPVGEKDVIDPQPAVVESVGSVGDHIPLELRIEITPSLAYRATPHVNRALTDAFDRSGGHFL